MNKVSTNYGQRYIPAYMNIFSDMQSKTVVRKNCLKANAYMFQNYLIRVEVN